MTTITTQRLLKAIRWADNLDLAYKVAAGQFLYWTSLYLLVVFLK